MFFAESICAIAPPPPDTVNLYSSCGGLRRTGLLYVNPALSVICDDNAAFAAALPIPRTPGRAEQQPGRGSARHHWAAGGDDHTRARGDCRTADGNPRSASCRSVGARYHGSGHHALTCKPARHCGPAGGNLHGKLKRRRAGAHSPRILRRSSPFARTSPLPMHSLDHHRDPTAIFDFAPRSRNGPTRSR